jgi:hypothetical protein
MLLTIHRRQTLMIQSGGQGRPLSRDRTYACYLHRRMKIDVLIWSEKCRIMLTAGTSEPRDAGNAAAGADGLGRGEGARQSRGKKCAHCLKLQKDREPGQPTFKKCGQCRTTFYCGAQVQYLEILLLYFLLCRVLSMCLVSFSKIGIHCGAQLGLHICLF